MEGNEGRNISLLCCQGRAEAVSFQKGGKLPAAVARSFEQDLAEAE